MILLYLILHINMTSNLSRILSPTAAPKDRHLCYKVMPVLHDSCAPPQLMYSTLGITSPPSINVVLRQIRMLTEVESTLDHWTYKHGSVEQVFSELFSYLQGMHPESHFSLYCTFFTEY